jgi:hypothetical protein
MPFIPIKKMQLALAMPRRELGTRVEARTKEFERCLKLGADWIFTMDDDQTVPMEGLMSVLKIAHTASIIVCDASNKGKMDSNIIYHPNGLLDHFTISCCLVKASSLAKLAKPWFRSDLAYIGKQPIDGRNVYEIEPKHTDDNIGEDVYFSKKVLEAGWKIKIMPFKSKHIEL